MLVEKNFLTFKKGDLVKLNATFLNQESKKEIEELKIKDKYLILDNSKNADFLQRALIKQRIQKHLSFKSKNKLDNDKTINTIVKVEILEFKTKEEIETLNALSNELNEWKTKAETPKIIKQLTVPQEEQDRIKKYALQNFFDDLLSPYLTLKNAVKAGSNSSNDAVQNYVKGFEMVLKMIENVFNNAGLEEIIPTINSEFDPVIQKVLEQVIDDNLAPNTIVKVASNGYKLFDRTLKPALVVTSKLSTNDQLNNDEE